MPIGAMIGALMGLGNLASGSELVVTRASGVSVWRIAWPVGLAGLTLALLMYGIGEYVAPPLAQFAKREKTTEKLADVSFAGSSGAWVKEGNLILRVQTGEVDQSFGGVSLFELDGSNRVGVHSACGAHFRGRSRPLALAECRDHALRPRPHHRQRGQREDMRSTVNPDFLGLAATDPQLLTLRGLASYIDHLRRNSLDTASTKSATGRASRVCSPSSSSRCSRCPSFSDRCAPPAPGRAR